MSVNVSSGDRPLASVITVFPGIILAALVAWIGHFAAPYVARTLPIPAMVLALALGIALNPSVERLFAQPGTAFCARVVLRWAVALLGLRVALSDIASLGIGTGLLVVISMVATLFAGFFLARAGGCQPGFGAMVGAATAVCGASATLAVSTVVPDYPRKAADVAFVVIAANALATLAMLLYPPLCSLLGFDAQSTGVMLGATIHDVAQVAGAGYGVSEPVGNTAVVVKLFRVFLLLPVVAGISWYFSRLGAKHGEARVPIPVFAIVFLGLCLLNSTVPLMPGVAAMFGPLKELLVQASTWGLMIGISALGLNTSIRAVIGVGWRPIAIALTMSVVICAIVTGGQLLIQAR